MTHLGWFSLEFSVRPLQSVLIFSNLAQSFLPYSMNGSFQVLILGLFYIAKNVT